MSQIESTKIAEKEQLVIRRLAKIQSTDYDPHHRVYKLDVYWEGSSSL